MAGFKVEVIEASALDVEAYCRLQRAAFAELLAQRGVSDDFITPEFFRWKYRPPTGDARVAIVREGDRIVASNAMYPVTIHSRSSWLRGWQSCDTATAPENRRQGHFSTCLRALVPALGEDEVFFGFPNQSSMRGFLKLGWTENALVTTWVTPLPVPSQGSTGRVSEVARFDAGVDDLRDRLGAEASAILDRGAAYLNWRYTAHPFARYSLFEHTADGTVDGFAVVRRVDAVSRWVTLIMELWAESAAAHRELIRAIRRWAWRRRAPFLAILCAGTVKRPLPRAGFVPVPSSLLPKRQVLMGLGTGPRSSSLIRGRWRIQTGDWDAF